ncbi:TRAP transporter small permease subunit [Pelagibius litoralis]|uniref:TRAP transporter small permease protein n=1 Tax=Pelagibius litoralis TaxID=374515 RepID=A0A967C267_9PROT|nr:TRAP transporter small permease subunit [Pelagibius litoralis]NIA68881.1 TRAP transporter small permease subunit [Pelagibius litoralis]
MSRDKTLRHVARELIRQPDLLFSMIIFLGFLVLCSLQVVVRFVLTLPLTWTEELTSALVIWMTFLGIIAVQRRDSQIRVELLDSILPPVPLAIIYGLFDIAVLACLVAIVAGGWTTLEETAYQRTPALGIPLNVLIAVTPMAAAAMAVFVVRNAVRRLRRALGGGT